MTAGFTQTASGRVNAAGQLVEADPRLLALQMRAGGVLGGILAVPQLASVARLAQNLGILVSRNVLAADGQDDVDLIVRAKPHGDCVILDIGGWTTLARARARFGAADDSPHTDIFWQADALLQITKVAGDVAGDFEIGERLDKIVMFKGNDAGDYPIIPALAARVPFQGQLATLRAKPECIYSLSALPVFDSAAVLRGWRGRATVNAEQAIVEDTVAVHALPRSPIENHARQLNAALRVPLERIVDQAGNISAHAEGPIDTHYIDYAHDIAAAGRHLLGLVSDLGDVEQIEADGFKIEGQLVDLADVARRAASLLSVRAADRNVRIEAPFIEDVLIARGDFRRILQILVNLITNAVRYSPAQSVVWVRTELEGDLAAIVVADQGKGIPAEAHEHIFDKFARLDTNEPGGSGLGLYISRRLARAMGGDISVDSAPGQGARFVLTLPTA